MHNCIGLSDMLAYLFDRDDRIEKAERILRGLLEARSARLSAIAEKMAGLPETNYKMLQRFLGKVDLKASLGRLFQADAEFVIGDPTELPRPQAKKTAYVG